jgi:5-methylcytosine-specific restriction protein A
MSAPTAKRVANREHDARRRAEKPWRAWYSSAQWKAVRMRQLQTQPLCERCLAADVITPATVCHHTVPHRGSADLFWRGPFASSCAPCHDIDAQREENGGKARQVVGADGWPL